MEITQTNSQTSFADSFIYELIELLKEDSDYKIKLRKVSALNRKLFADLTGGAPVSLTTTYARIIFACEMSGAPEELKKDLVALNRMVFDEVIDFEKAVEFASATFLRAVEHFYTAAAPAEFAALVNLDRGAAIPVKKRAPQERLDAALSLVVKSKVPIIGTAAPREIVCESDEFGEITITISHPALFQFYNYCWPSATFNAFNLKVEADGSFVADYYSLLVLEPDILVDVTDVAECFQTNSYEPFVYFIKQFTPRISTEKMLIGNLVNHFFDELIMTEKATFDEEYERALKLHPLQTLAIFARNPNCETEIKKEVKWHYALIANALEKLKEYFKFDSACLEPSFIVPLYGLTGRLDAMFESAEFPDQKNIIELKSGTAPNPDYQFRVGSQTPIKTGVWKNHFAQITLYNLLLDGSFKNRTGVSMALYSKGAPPLRDVPDAQIMKLQTMEVRNFIVAAEKSLGAGRTRLFQNIRRDKLREKLPPYNMPDLINFENGYRRLSDLERDYFHFFAKRLYRERFSQRVGSDSDGYAYSSLWREPIESKVDSFSALDALKIDYSASDFSRNYIKLIRPEPRITSLRRGDIVALYHEGFEDGAGRFEQQILRGSIKHIDSESVLVSLRNKYLPSSYFFIDRKWRLEPDMIDGGDRRLVGSMFSFLTGKSPMKEYLLGQKEPRLDESFDPAYDMELDAGQNELLNRAIACQPYFLLQGPPGTGKTSLMLKNLVRRYSEDPEEIILVAAFTNRAVDEICEKLDLIPSKPKYLRLGSKECTDARERLLPELAEKLSLTEIRTEIYTSKIIVSTVSSLLANPEIFVLKKFTTAIIDEASQVLEPQLLPILSQARKFILIGDEKQLPAVVSQDLTENGEALSPTLSTIGVTSFACSLFERLLRNAKRRGWNSCYGMLSKQARMHVDIQEISNKFFYGSSLEPMREWQRELDATFNGSEGTLDGELSRSRIVFYSVPQERASKVNRAQARLVADIASLLARKLGHEFNDRSLGIIAPYRAQCSEIIKALPEDLRGKALVDTVERFQGSERDTIIISLSVNHERMLSKLCAPVEIDGSLVDRKLNVAITRARKRLIVLGCEETLSKSPVYGNLINYIKENGAFIERNGTI